MNCIYCSNDTKVTNSRPQKRLNHVWRRRQCKTCGIIFTSVETTDLSGSIVVGSGNALQPFSRDKLLLSVHDSLKHRKTALRDSTSLTDTVIGQLLPQIQNATLQRVEIIQTTLSILKRFDSVAATHYQAFHKI